MQRTFLLAAILVLTVPALSLAADTDAEKDVAKLQNQINEAMIKVDTAFLDGVLADDFLIISPNGDFEDKEKHLKDIKEGIIKYDAIDKSNVKVRVHGDTAVVTGNAMVKVRFKGQVIGGPSSFTDVFNRQGGKWRSISVQVTRVAAQSGEKP